MNFWNELPEDQRRRLPQPPPRDLFESDAEHGQAQAMWQMLVMRLVASLPRQADGAASPEPQASAAPRGSQP